MLEKEKTDAVLGEQIQGLLESIGLQTPTVHRAASGSLTTAEKISVIEDHMRKILDILDFDLGDDSMKDTPKRVAKMMVNEQFWGLSPKNFPKMTTFPNTQGLNSMVMERGIPFSSNCAHHLVSIRGKAAVAYIPDGCYLGLSKLNRLVEYFSRRPQTQEQMTEQIQKSLCYILQTENVAVSVTAVHHCVACRGIQHDGCDTVTNAFGGVFLQSCGAREEFLHFVKPF